MDHLPSGKKFAENLDQNPSFKSFLTLTAQISITAPTVSLQSWTQLTEVIWMSVLITAALIRSLASSNVQFLLLLTRQLLELHGCQGMSLTLFVPLYVSSVLTGSWMLSYGSPLECHAEEDPASGSCLMAFSAPHTVKAACCSNCFIVLQYCEIARWNCLSFPGFIVIQEHEVFCNVSDFIEHLMNTSE